MTPRRTLTLVGALFLTCLTVFAVPGQAQNVLDTDPGSAIRTRAELEELLELYEGVLDSPAYSEGVKRATRVRAERIRQRLERGDFELGDRVVIDIRGQPDLPDTVAVQAGPRLTLPIFGEIPLRGVLRSEIEEHLTEALSHFIRDPNVTARALMRVSVQGAVGAPGFYVVPADILLSETIMVAGGPGPSSDLGDMRIERGSRVLMEGSELQEALRQGYTLDQLNLQAGDQVVVPEDSGGFWGQLGLIAGVASTAAFMLLRIF